MCSWEFFLEVKEEAAELLLQDRHNCKRREKVSVDKGLGYIFNCECVQSKLSIYGVVVMNLEM